MLNDSEQADAGICTPTATPLCCGVTDGCQETRMAKPSNGAIHSHFRWGWEKGETNE